MKPYPHQAEIAPKALDILRTLGWVYLAMEERTGKTLISIMAFEQSKASSCLVLTKKKAIGGWLETLGAYTKATKTKVHDGMYKYTWDYKGSKKSLIVTNYQNIHKRHKNSKGQIVYKQKLSKSMFGFIILDEAHAYLSACPKTGTTWSSVKKLTVQKPIIFMSATPCAQGYQQLYNQLKLSSWSPWKQFTTFYKWHNRWGIPDKVRTPYGLKETYTKCKPEVYDHASKGFISHTRKDLGFEQEPEDELHYVELTADTKEKYNQLMKRRILLTESESGEEVELVCDSPIKLRTSLHMIEGGVAKTSKYYVLENMEKINYILAKGWDSKETVVMYNYIAEGTKLRKYLKNATILQGTSNAEGVDLSNFKHLIIYSQNFSTAKYTQRRARQANKKRTTPIIVHFLLVADAISEQVHTTVSVNKTNFVDSIFEKKELI